MTGAGPASEEWPRATIAAQFSRENPRRVTFGPGIERAVIAPLQKSRRTTSEPPVGEGTRNIMFEGHATASPRDDRHRRDDEPEEFLYVHPAGFALSVVSGAAAAGLVVLLGAWLATPLVGVGAARPRPAPPTVS